MREQMIDAWSAAQSLGRALNAIETFLRADDRLGALEQVREARADLGRVALAMSDVWQETAPRPPAWMTTDAERRPTNHEDGRR